MAVSCPEPSPVTWPRRIERRAFLWTLQWISDGADTAMPRFLHICNMGFPGTSTCCRAKATFWGSLPHFQAALLRAGNYTGRIYLNWQLYACSFFLFYQTATMPWAASCNSLVRAFHHCNRSVDVYLISKPRSDISSGLTYIHHNCFSQTVSALFYFLQNLILSGHL